MIERLFRNPKTTIIGLAIMIVSFAFVWFGKSTLTEVSAFIMGGFALLFFKDPDKIDGGKS
jgi:amino acid permease